MTVDKEHNLQHYRVEQKITTDRSTNYQNLSDENGRVDKQEEESCRESSVCAISTTVITKEVPSSFSSSLENTQEIRSTRRNSCVIDSQVPTCSKYTTAWNFDLTNWSNQDTMDGHSTQHEQEYLQTTFRNLTQDQTHAVNLDENSTQLKTTTENTTNPCYK